MARRDTQYFGADKRQRQQSLPAHNSTRTKAVITKDGRVVGSNRDLILFIVFCVVAVFLILQLVNLQIVQAADLSKEAKALRTTTIEVPAKRGTIYDRNYNVLAISVDATTIYANPKDIADPLKTAKALVGVLGGKEADYYSLLTQDTTFVYIRQKADVALAQKLKDKQTELKDAAAKAAYEKDPYATVPNTELHGIYYLKDTRRDYPYGDTGMQVIGKVDVDGNGLFGLEQMYDSVLKGRNGTTSAEYSRENEKRPLSGKPIPGSERNEVAPIDGSSIVISLDIDLQQYVETELSRVGKERKTENGNALVLDGGNGEIYAAASLPLAKRSMLTQEEVDKGAINLKPIVFGYEPGSTFKPITAAAVLEEKAMSLEEVLYVPFSRSYTEYTISDAHEHLSDMMDFKTIIAESSNVGISMVKDRISNEVYAQYLDKFGINSPTHVDFPGENTGSLSKVKDWTDVQTANIAFGQGVAVSSLQIASFYGAVANDGLKYNPHFLIDRPQSIEDGKYRATPEEIMSSKTATALHDMLKYVVSNGTGQAAAIDGYTMAGKTGTAEKAAPEGGYLPDNYIVSFVGFFAGSDSKLTCITSMDNPEGAEGNAPTGPLFASIMKFAANRYMIEPSVSSNVQAGGEQ
jgi:cell division protein FtsI (penicillin-binding protein 3)